MLGGKSAQTRSGLPRPDWLRATYNVAVGFSNRGSERQSKAQRTHESSRAAMEDFEKAQAWAIELLVAITDGQQRLSQPGVREAAPTALASLLNALVEPAVVLLASELVRQGDPPLLSGEPTRRDPVALAAALEQIKSRGDQDESNGRRADEWLLDWLGVQEERSWRDASADTLYNLACYYTVKTKFDEALTRLEWAALKSPQLGRWAREDPALSGLRRKRGWGRVVGVDPIGRSTRSKH